MPCSLFFSSPHSVSQSAPISLRSPSSTLDQEPLSSNGPIVAAPRLQGQPCCSEGNIPRPLAAEWRLQPLVVMWFCPVHVNDPNQLLVSRASVRVRGCEVCVLGSFHTLVVRLVLDSLVIITARVRLCLGQGSTVATVRPARREAGIPTVQLVHSPPSKAQFSLVSRKQARRRPLLLPPLVACGGTVASLLANLPAVPSP
jgi:hypothetical protein